MSLTFVCAALGGSYLPHAVGVPSASPGFDASSVKLASIVAEAVLVPLIAFI